MVVTLFILAVLHFDCVVFSFFRGRNVQSVDGSLASMSSFAKILRPSVFFTEGTIMKMGSLAQVLSRSRWVLAHVNNNLSTLQMVSSVQLTLI